VVDDGEECDVPGETGAYSTTIAGRQCNAVCNFGPYCGDGILQTFFGEECDDGNNVSGDFCSATCQIEPAGSGGGGSSGGGSASRGGSDRELGDTQISISGRGYPGRTINVLLDSESVGTVQADSQGRFEFSTEANPGTATLGIWANDSSGTRSITLNSTFDVTQGAVTNVNGLILPPTLRLSNANPNPGDTVTLSGQAVPSARIEVSVGTARNLTASSSGTGAWQTTLATAGLSAAQYAVRARSVTTSGALSQTSNFSSVVSMFLGVDGQATAPSDLNRDGKVNLTDFSILIFWWGTTGGDSSPSADINGNGRVGIEDFSILLFNWSG
jgi:cysteine-rich repeat protein